MGFGADDAHGIEQGHIALVIIRRIRVDFKTIALYSNLGETGFLRLTEHTGEKVKVVLDVMVFVILEEFDIIGIFSLHPLTVVRIIALMATGSSDEIECTIVRAIRTAFITGHVLIITSCHFFTIGDSAENRRNAIGVNRANDFIGMVVSLQRDIYLTILEDRQHTITEDRRLLIRRVVRTGEEVEVGERYTPRRVRVRCRLIAEPLSDMVGQIS